MKVIVFGGTGWVGHHIVRAFAGVEHEVSLCSRGQKSDFLDEIPEAVRLIQADKNDPTQVAEIFEEEYDVVVDSVPTEASIDNVHEYARRLKRYLHCSSTGGYAPLPFVPGDETMPYDQFMGGWKQKAVVDAKVLNLWLEDGFPATVIRPCYITGPGRVPIDNLGGRREDFIADILDEKVLDLPNDGLALLQPIHVEDLALSFLLAAEEPRSIGQIYNICQEKALPISCYIEITAEALGREAHIELMPVEDMLAKYGDAVSERGLRFFANHMCFDISKAREQIGYEPHCTTEEAIEETARWNAEQLGA